MAFGTVSTAPLVRTHAWVFGANASHAYGLGREAILKSMTSFFFVFCFVSFIFFVILHPIHLAVAKNFLRFIVTHRSISLPPFVIHFRTCCSAKPHCQQFCELHKYGIVQTTKKFLNHSHNTIQICS